MDLAPAQLTRRPFDTQPPVYRRGAKGRVIEGVTYTDNFEMVGYTYNPTSGFLVIKSRDPMNVVQYRGRIKDEDGFEKAIKRASKNINKPLTRRSVPSSKVEKPND